MSEATFITRVVLENYKSIAACDVPLQALTFLVGPNAAGKSNFLDALAFLQEALAFYPEYALHGRGGLGEVLRRASDRPLRFGMRLEFQLPPGTSGHYALSVGWREGRAAVLGEECVVRGAAETTPPAYFRTRESTIETSVRTPAPVLPDRLYLVSASAYPTFRPVYDLFSSLRVYHLRPGAIGAFPDKSSKPWLNPDGENLATVLERIQAEAPDGFERVLQYLRVILPSLDKVEVVPVGPGRMLRFWQRLAGFNHPQPFWAGQMSAGTLRALGILVALLQVGKDDQGGPQVVGIEEPEAQIYPAALAVLRDAMTEASYTRQVLVTTHSSDILDEKDVTTDGILGVAADDGPTRIAAVNEASRSVVRDRLFTVGELLRIGQLEPEKNGTPSGEGVRLFDTEGSP